MQSYIDDFYNFIGRWRTDYCVGSPMPESFRKKCSELFEYIYKNDNFQNSKVKNNTIIYRAIDISNIIYCNKKFNLDDLYYSFSKDIEGIQGFCSFDKYLKNGKFILLECESIDALDYEKLLDYLYEDYNPSTDRYSKEHEVVSRLNKQSIKNIYYIRQLSDLENLDQCHHLALEDFKKSNLKKLIK